MSYQLTTATKKLAALSKRIRAVAGGTAASKTISILLILIDRAQRDKTPTLTSVVSESFPHLKRGAMRDFKLILETQNYWKENRWNATDCIYTLETGSKIEFFSADQPGKVRGPRRERLFINESNNIPLETFDQLEVRTKEFVFLDWNPVSSFWFYEDIQGKRNDVDFLTLTYKDNEALSPEIVQSIERRMNNKAWWTVYGLGQLGEIEARIYKNWQVIDDLPHEARLERRGLDYGYTNDQTAVVDIYKYNGGYILDEQCYQLGMSNRAIADLLKNLPEPQTIVYADSAEPKSNDELKSYGLVIVPATKGPGSVSQGIQFVQDQRISVTKRSVNLLKEYRGYLWKTDKDGKTLNVPEDGTDHCLDALRYGLSGLTANDGLDQKSILYALERKAEYERSLI